MRILRSIIFAFLLSIVLMTGIAAPTIYKQSVALAQYCGFGFCDFQGLVRFLNNAQFQSGISGFMYNDDVATVVVTTATFTPTANYQPISSTATVTPVVAVLAKGICVTLDQRAAQSAVFVDSGNHNLTGNITLGQNDTLTLCSNGTKWDMVGTANN